MLDEMYDEYADEIRESLTHFSGDEEASADAVQHAFVQAMIRWELLEMMPEPAAKAWIFSVARNALIDIKRKQRRFLAELSGGVMSEESGDQTDKIYAEQLISKLDDELQTIVRMRYYGGLNSAQIGTVLGIPAATVRTRLRTALIIMRKDEDIES